MPWALPLIIVAIAGFYRLVNPVIQNYPIQCLWKLLTGTQCPACGFQRACHALVHGHPLEALSYNYFFVLSIPLAITVILCEWYNWHHKFDGLRVLVHHPCTLKGYIALFFTWWVLRNILGI